MTTLPFQLPLPLSESRGEWPTRSETIVTRERQRANYKVEPLHKDRYVLVPWCGNMYSIHVRDFMRSAMWDGLQSGVVFIEPENVRQLKSPPAHFRRKCTQQLTFAEELLYT